MSKEDNDDHDASWGEYRTLLTSHITIPEDPMTLSDLQAAETNATAASTKTAATTTMTPFNDDLRMSSTSARRSDCSVFSESPNGDEKDGKGGPFASSVMITTVADVQYAEIDKIKSNKPSNDGHCLLNTFSNTVKRFNVMVAGSAGAGKSTFCRAAFRNHFSNFTMAPLEGPTLEIAECGRGDVVLGNERIIVSVIDSVGGFHPEKHIKKTAEYLERQHLEYEKKELCRKRNDSSEDTRVACLFYFFGPHRVHDEDLSFLEALHNKAPIVPIVSKADSLTTCELAEQLHLIREKLMERGIQYFDFGETDIDEDWLTALFDRNAFSNLGRSMMEGDAKNAMAAPFVIPARPMIRNVFAVISGFRQYMWGTAREDDPNHSDTKRLHKVFFGNLGKLLDKMEEIHLLWRDQYLARQERHRKSILIFVVIVVVVSFFLIFLFVFVARDRNVLGRTSSPALQGDSYNVGMDPLLQDTDVAEN